MLAASLAGVWGVEGVATTSAGTAIGKERKAYLKSDCLAIHTSDKNLHVSCFWMNLEYRKVLCSWKERRGKWL
jgi:hypothetical protein